MSNPDTLEWFRILQDLLKSTDMQPDWDYWRKCDTWTLLEGMYLSLGFNPSEANRLRHRDIKEMFEERYSLARKSVSKGTLKPCGRPRNALEEYDPLDLLLWAKDKNLPMPPEPHEMLEVRQADLAERQGKADTMEELRGRVNHLEAECAELKKKADQRGKHHLENHIEILEAGINRLVCYRDECEKDGKISGQSLAKTIDDHRVHFGWPEEDKNPSLQTIKKKIRAALKSRK